MAHHQDVDLDDQLWTWRHVAAFTHRARSATFDLTAQPWFPLPLDLGTPTDRVWVAEEVRTAFLTRPRGNRHTIRGAETDPAVAGGPQLGADLLDAVDATITHLDLAVTS